MELRLPIINQDMMKKVRKSLVKIYAEKYTGAPSSSSGPYKLSEEETTLVFMPDDPCCIATLSIATTGQNQMKRCLGSAS